MLDLCKAPLEDDYWEEGSVSHTETDTPCSSDSTPPVIVSMDGAGKRNDIEAGLKSALQGASPEETHHHNKTLPEELSVLIWY